MLRTALILGLLSIVGPFAIDMYLPAMPAIGKSLGASDTAVQTTITGYFVAFGIAQLIYGPWADQAGRKVPIITGLVIFTIGSLGAATAGSVGFLVAWRVLQGLGGAVLMVVPRAIIRDMYTGADGTRLMSMLMLVISISPMLAPLAGSGVLAVSGWRAIFFVMAIFAGAGLAITLFLQPETLPKDQRVKVNLRSLARGAKTLLTDPIFMALTFIGGFGMASFFIFLSFAPFVYTGQYGLGPTEFSIAFAVNAIGFFTASQFAGHLGARWGMQRLVRRGVGGFVAMTLALMLVVMLGDPGLYVIIAGLLLANACLGVVIPTVMVVALDEHGDIAGLASSLGGTLQMLTGGAAVALAGPFFNGTAAPMVVAIALSALAAGVLTVAVLRQGVEPEATV
jgi:MFS transporter, DHA1 family, multidrug resistance protein